MDWNRILPVVFAVAYLAIGLYIFISEPSRDTGFIFFFILILIGASVSMIWSEDGASGSWSEMSHGKWRYTPGCFVRLGGWVLLLLPIWLPLIVLLIRWMD